MSHSIVAINIPASGCNGIAWIETYKVNRSNDDIRNLPTDAGPRTVVPVQLWLCNADAGS
jgi:hypothetical protein